MVAESGVLSIDLGDGKTVDVTRIGNVPPARSAFFLGVPKSGSTLLHQVVEDICFESRQELINISDSCFKAGIRERFIPDPILPGLPDNRPAFYYGFRLIGKLAKSRAFRLGPKVILVRDPRDALTSLYFSMQRSHMVPVEGDTSRMIARQRELANAVTIDEFVQSGNGDFIIDAMRDIGKILWLPNVYLYRYEDIILRKRAWIRHLSDRAGLTLSDEVLEKVLEKHDIVPEGELPGDHIRQVRPGNYLRHLGPDTIDYIRRKGADVLQTFAYH